MPHETYPGLSERVRNTGGNTQRVHVVPCSCDACQNEIEIAICGRRKPFSVIRKIAQRNGWETKRTSFICPEHAQ